MFLSSQVHRDFMHLNAFDNCTVIFCQANCNALIPEMFDVAYWQQKDAVIGESKGRYTTWFVQTDKQYDAQQWVLRHYWRGGLIGKFCKDSYFYTGLEHTRAYGELAILNTLHQEGFSVPKPIAAKVERMGFWYRADIIIERVSGAKDLVAHLNKQALSDIDWQALGKTIAKFHQRGVYHADLNAKNILLADDMFYLIDFDRGELRSPQSSWQQANLQRLLRSFRKELNKQTIQHFNDDNWQQLLAGYQTVIN